MRLLLTSLLLAGCAARPAPAAPRSTATLTVASYNLNYGLAGDAATLAALRATDADVLVLQEVSDAWAATLDRALRDRWPHRCVARSDWPAGGGSIRSRFPLEGCARSPSPSGWFPALAATVRSPVGAVRVVNVHLRPARGGVAVLADLGALPAVHRDEIRTHLGRLTVEGQPMILAGDFNEGDGEGAVGELAARGWASAVARHAPEATTWRWPAVAMPIEKRLDHVLYTPGALDCFAAEVRRGGRSDHQPVVARFRAPAPAPLTSLARLPSSRPDGWRTSMIR